MYPEHLNPFLMKKRLYLILSIIFFSPITLSAQSAESIEKQIISTIDTLFEGMLQADSSKVRSTFTQNAIMQTVVSDDEKGFTVSDGSLSRFLNSVAGSIRGDLREELHGYEIQQDGRLASVWTPYTFYYKDALSHCGVNSFQMINKGDEGWKITYIIDTRIREGCTE